MINFRFWQKKFVDTHLLERDIRKTNKRDEIVKILDNYDGLEISHKINRNVGGTLAIMGFGAVATLASPALAIHKDCFSKDKNIQGCGSSAGSLMGAVADALTLIVGIRNLVLTRSHLAHHVVNADEQLDAKFGALVRTDSRPRAGTDMLARYQQLSSDKREALKQRLTGPSVSNSASTRDLATNPLLVFGVEVPLQEMDETETV